MVTVMISDIYPGAKFRQGMSTAIMVIDKIENGIVFYYYVNESGEKGPDDTEPFDSLIYLLNVAGYEKIEE